jgi:hypothetical protein
MVYRVIYRVKATRKNTLACFSHKIIIVQDPQKGTTTLAIMTLSMMTFSVRTLSIKSLFVTLSINDTDHN